VVIRIECIGGDKPRTEERLDKIENMVIDLQKNIVEILSKIQVTLTTMQDAMSTNQGKIITMNQVCEILI
jgi:hypothetical protein